MKKITLTALTLILCSAFALSQELTQTVRGTITDTDSNLPLIGVGVWIQDSDPYLSTSTDANGNYRFENVAVGRVTIAYSYIGYENKVLSSIVVNSGKEVVLNLSLQESLVQIEEAVVSGGEVNGEALNEMSIVSVRSISPEETSRYAGGFNDPSRIMSNFAGVTSTQDGSNDVIIRGNSPKYMQWRLEGVEISNPNHFADQGGIGGGISALNNNLLATSDFYTGAFSPEFGNALSGVYDVQLRSGNNEKFESVFGFGLLGTDLTLEGPFKKGYGGSFLVNYRYSTISAISDLGLVDIDGLLNFQDASFKVVLPTKKLGIFSLFGLAGYSSFVLEDITPVLWDTPGDNPLNAETREDFEKGTYLFNSGLKHTLTLNDKSYLKTILSYSSQGIDDDVFEKQVKPFYDNQGEWESDSLINRRLDFQNKLMKSSYRGAVTYFNKLSPKSKIQIGTKYSLLAYDNDQSMLRENSDERVTLVNFKEDISTIRNFISWKYRVNENITIVSGLHNMNVLLNNESTLEPRLAANWKLDNTNSIHVGFGKHSIIETISHYFTQLEVDGNITEPNNDLELLKANHYVLGYEKKIGKAMMAKLELYYQDLYDLPVENDITSFYSTINEGFDPRFVDLVNEGTGKNYGVEVTFERFFSNNYYYLINASVYESKYTALDGIERNTSFNSNYLVNILAGKEFDNLGNKNNQSFGLNAKIFFGGGRKIIPLLRDQNGNLAVDPANNSFWDYEKAYENSLEDVYTIVLSTSYKWNKPKATHELFLSLDNLTNTKGKISEFYDENEEGSVGHLTQFGFFPNLMYKVYF